MMAALRPFYLPDDGGLYCCLHGGAPSARTGVLCVQPLFGEYIQHHRAFVVLAEHLAGRGMPCFRYDHYGTGDSAADLPQACVTRWLRDIEATSEALVRMTGVERLIVVGARFGATLALEAAARIVRAVGLVQWEPLWSGRAFLESLLRTHRQVLAPYFPADGTEDPAFHDVLGFEIPTHLWDEIATFEPDGACVAPDIDVLVLGSAESLEGRDRLLGHERVFARVVDYPRGWLDPERGMYDVLVPADALDELARWIEARS